MFLLELMFDAVVEMWFYAMEWVVPGKALGKRTRMIIKALVGIFSCALFVTLFLGFFAVISDDEQTRKLGIYLICIPIIVSIVQILLGIVVRKILKK